MSRFAPGLVSPTARPVDVMAAYLGVREVGGPNRGPWVDECLRFVGLEPREGPPGGYPWCAASLVWCCWRAGVTIPKTASVHKLADKLAARQLEQPEPGCIFVHLAPKGRGHTGFWTADLQDGRAMTLSGNTNDEGGREGMKVAWVPHKHSYFSAFFHVHPDEGAVG